MSNITSCPFCNLGKRVIIDNGYASLFLNNQPQTEGHVLISPKRHLEDPWEMSVEEQQAVWDLIYLAQKRIATAYSGGSDLRQHHRPFMPQDDFKIDHVHYHVIPRAKDDAIYRLIEQHEPNISLALTPADSDRIAKKFS